MKKAVLVITVLVIALIGLTSYNGTSENKTNNERLIASIKTEHPGNGLGNIGEGKKRKD